VSPLRSQRPAQLNTQVIVPEDYDGFVTLLQRLNTNTINDANAESINSIVISADNKAGDSEPMEIGVLEAISIKDMFPGKGVLLVTTKTKTVCMIDVRTRFTGFQRRLIRMGRSLGGIDLRMGYYKDRMGCHQAFIKEKLLAPLFEVLAWDAGLVARCSRSMNKY
jgi:hypothetical protein